MSAVRRMAPETIIKSWRGVLVFFGRQRPLCVSAVEIFRKVLNGSKCRKKAIRGAGMCSALSLAVYIINISKISKPNNTQKNRRASELFLVTDESRKNSAHISPHILYSVGRFAPPAKKTVRFTFREI